MPVTYAALPKFLAKREELEKQKQEEALLHHLAEECVKAFHSEDNNTVKRLMAAVPTDKRTLFRELVQEIINES